HRPLRRKHQRESVPESGFLNSERNLGPVGAYALETPQAWNPLTHDGGCVQHPNSGGDSHRNRVVVIRLKHRQVRVSVFIARIESERRDGLERNAIRKGSDGHDLYGRSVSRPGVYSPDEVVAALDAPSELKSDGHPVALTGCLESRTDFDG